MPETEHEVFGHLYQKDREKAESHISDGRVKILTDNGLHPVSDYTLQLLHMHYGRAGSLSDLLNEVHRVMDVGDVPRHISGAMSGLVERTNLLIEDWKHLKETEEATQEDFGFIGEYLDKIGIPKDESIVNRVANLCFLVLSVRELLGKLESAMGKLGETLTQKAQEAATNATSMQIISDLAFRLQESVAHIGDQLAPESNEAEGEECTSEQSEAETLEQ